MLTSRTALPEDTTVHEELSWKEKLIYPLLIAIGTYFLIIVTPGIQWDRNTIIFILVFGLICFLLHLRRFALWILRIQLLKVKKSGATRWIMDEILLYAALFIKGVGVAAWIIALASFAFQLYLLIDAISKRLKKVRKLKDRIHKKKPFPLGQVLYGFTSPFNRITMIVPAGIVYERINNGSEVLGSFNNILAVLAMFFVYFTIASFLSALSITLRENQSVKRLGIIWFWNYYSDLTIYIFMLCPLGLLFALIYQRQPYALVLIIVPLYAMHRAMKSFEKVLDESQRFIDSLANALDARDHYTYGHSNRVAKYSRAMAVEMGLNPQEIDDIDRAGRIHDIGKITIPDSILNKRGKLDDDEYKVMKSHATTVKELFQGRKRLSEKIPVELAYSHHERFDGKGYIFGKKGDEIPLGARILSVADTYDALTTDRPYRKGMEPQIALEYIKQAGGTQLDPAVVQIFITLFNKGIINELMEEKI